MKIKKPIFIVGCGRSGTGILFNTLAESTSVLRTDGYPDGEDHDGWIEHGDCVMAGIGSHPSAENYGNGINGYNYCLHMIEDDATDDVVARMHAHYWDSVLKHQDNLRVLNKQPHLSNKLRYLLKIFPDAKIIHIIRDCQSVVASWLAVMKSHPSLVAFLPNEEFPCFWLFPKPENNNHQSTLSRCTSVYPGAGENIWIDYWIKVNLGIKKQMVGKEEQLYTVKYEDFVGDPKTIINSLCDFSEIPCFNFLSENIINNTENKYQDLLSDELIKEINIKAKVARISFGYEG